MLDLGGKLAAHQTQATHELIAERYPFHVGVGYVMGVEVTRCAPKLGGGRYVGQHGELLFQPFGKHQQFFPQPGGRGRLAVGAGQHRHGGPLRGQFLQAMVNLPIRWFDFFGQCFPQQ